MKESSLVLALALILLPLFTGAVLAEIEFNESQINQVENETGQELPLGSLDLLYELKKNESLSEEATEKLNQDLEEKGIAQFLKERELNLTIKTIKNGTTHSIISLRFINGSIKDFYFGRYPRAGKDMQNLYLEIDLDFVEKLTSEWEEKTEGGEKEPGIGLLLSTCYRILKGLIQGKLKIKPFWAILKIGKFLRMNAAFRSSKTTAVILLN